MKKDIKKCKDLFESISCLCCEGPEFMSKMELMSAIGKDAVKGYDICKRHLIANAPDNQSRTDSVQAGPIDELIICETCGTALGCR